MSLYEDSRRKDLQIENVDSDLNDRQDQKDILEGERNQDIINTSMAEALVSI